MTARRSRLPVALASAALVVAVLGVTPLGEAATQAVRVALFAQNAGKVDNISASREPRAGQLLALNAKGKFPASVLPAAPRGQAGTVGAQGPAGPAGRPGPVGPRGPAGSSGLSYVRTIVVSPTADALESGDGLLGALDQLSGDPTKPYLVKVEPGLYDLGSRSLVMKPHVDIEGSGEGMTTITSNVSTGLGTIVGAANAALRFVTVKSANSGTSSLGITTESVSPSFSNVTVAVAGGAMNYAIRVSNGAPVFRNVTATATGGGEAVGLVNYGGSPSIWNSSFTGSAATGYSAGLITTFGGNLELFNSVVTASGGPLAYGMRAFSGSQSLWNVTVSGSGATQSYGIYAGQKHSAPTVTVHQSRVSGASRSLYLLDGAIRVGASQLSGGPVGLIEGSIVCAASYGAAFQALGANCS